MSTAITNKQWREKAHLECIFISRQARENRLLINGELYQRMLKQDVRKQRPSSLALFKENLRELSCDRKAS